MSELPCGFSELRLRRANDAPLNPEGHYVLYWMTSAQRCFWNFALQRAIAVAGELQVGLVVLEILPCDGPFASERLHRFAIEGMHDNAAVLSGTPVTHVAYVEESPAAGCGLMESLAAGACLVVTDDLPARFSPHLGLTPVQPIPVRLETVDGTGLLPLSLPEREYPTAYAFRRFLHKALPAFIDDRPLAEPLAGIDLPQVSLPEEILSRWPATSLDELLAPAGLDHLSIDHQVSPAPLSGGYISAKERLEIFVTENLDRYLEQGNVPDADCTSQLSPYLRFGQISSHQVFSRLAEEEEWNSMRLGLRPTGRRSGWWGMSPVAEAFLDELVTWRELGYLFCQHRDDYAEFSGLPDWARTTLESHRQDRRDYLYHPDEFAAAATHDPLWNAAQRQLVLEGRIHGYLRMLWGKKILEWSPDPETALRTMIDLNDRFALDGRDPNSYSGISWCLGRFDRAWGPERPVYGKIRYMSSKNTARKVAVKDYLRRYAE